MCVKYNLEMDGSVASGFYSPLEPFFTKQWRPSEIELVR